MSEKEKIKYGNEARNVPSRYVPKTLSKQDRKKQIKSIIEGTDRPKLKTFTSKRSPHVIKFEKKYGFKITDKRVQEIIKPEGIRQILAKGKAAFYSSGSRPNQTATSWAYARLASALMGGKASKIDKKILDEYLIK